MIASYLRSVPVRGRPISLYIYPQPSLWVVSTNSFPRSTTMFPEPEWVDFDDDIERYGREGEFLP